jgi:hypothetical protein
VIIELRSGQPVAFKSDYKSAEPFGIVTCSLADKKSNQCESALGEHREYNYIEAIDHHLWTGYQEGRQPH